LTRLGLVTVLTTSISACRSVPPPPIDSCSWIGEIDAEPYIVRGSSRWDQVQATIGLNLALIEMSSDPQVREQAIVIIRSEIENPRNILTPDLARRLGAQNEAIRANCAP
jgi:hypothetical protein